MRLRRLSGKRRCLGALALAALALANTGCLVVAGAAAAGGVAGYAYYRGSVPGDFAGSFEQVWAATQGALGDLGLPVTAALPGTGQGTLESHTSSGDHIEILVEALPPAQGPQTRVSVRVGLFGDQAVSDRILNQIQSRLGGASGGAPPATSEPPVTAASSPEPPLATPPQTASPPLAEPPAR
jgi:hypothetical protein